jgi:hypothetical protein
MGHRPGHVLPPAGLGHGAAPLGDFRAQQPAQPAGQPAPRRHRGQRLGERHTAALLAGALPPPLAPGHRDLVQAPAQVTGPGQHVLVHPARDRPAVRARSRPRVIGDHPDSERAVGLPLNVGHLQAFHAEQRRCPILGHSARGFLMIMKSSARSMILGAAGVLITPPRPASAPHQPERPTALTQRHQAATRSRLTSKSRISGGEH